MIENHMVLPAEDPEAFYRQKDYDYIESLRRRSNTETNDYRTPEETVEDRAWWAEFWQRHNERIAEER